MTQRELKFDPAEMHYTGIIGTGGIGSGKFFVLNGNHSLGREESRSGRFLDIKDYCKQHIILHYVRVLLGPYFEVIPVGKVGNDDAGQMLINEMSETGLTMKWIEKVPQASTLFSFCFYYPDGSGGNLTTDNSASSMVDEACIRKAIPEMQKLGKKGIVMAAPEVPLSARMSLIELGKDHGLFCTASFTTGEIAEVMKSGTIDKTDLIAVNIDEAAAIAGMSAGKADNVSIVEQSVKNLRKRNVKIMVSITAGKEGSWCWDGSRLNRFPAARTEAVSTAGAGDAFFSGIISGLAIGLPLFEAQQLASLIAGLSVCSPDTIHKGIDRHALCQFSKNSGIEFSDTVLKLLEE
jgi:ribokinase